MPKMGICLVCGCSEDEVEKMHYFPKNTEKSRIWQENMGIKFTGTSLRNYRICSRHFSKQCYKNLLTYELHQEAKPTLHSSQASSNEASNSTDISVRNTCMTSHANEVQLFSGVPEVVSGDERIPLQQEIISDVNTESKPESSHVKTSKCSYFKGIADLEKRTASSRKLKLMEMVVRREDHIRKLKYLCKRRAHDIKALSDLSDSDVMDLKQINAACRVTPQKPIQKLHDLPIDFPNEIICAKQVSGKFVSQILLELEDCVVFLPQRATSVLENHVDSLKGYRLVFRGTRNFGSQHHETADFEFLEPL
ncbi:hypothetical protein ABEB36_000278 [Hypothenemus hampei]|uniref:THAP-type domain-containing protein n=2 Tax=Hypothenemus hampei TaxID=57062 RepID=A0ABD1FAQ3_HYPHA